MVKVAIIDSDSIIYRAALSVEKTKFMVESPDGGFLTCENGLEALALAEELRGDVWTRTEVGKVEDAVKRFNDILDGILFNVKPDLHVLYLTGLGPSIRDSVARLRKYKGNRSGTPRPTYFNYLREFAAGVHGAICEHNEEADDLVSIRTYEEAEVDNTPIVVGNDKDLDQIPGQHYDWVTNTFYAVTDQEARKWMWTQALYGDPGDNVPGCWKIGEAKARSKIAQWFKDDLPDWRLWDLIVEEYRASQEIAGCPYKNDDPARVVEETVGLIRLKTTRDDKPWTRSTIKRNEKKDHGRENQEKGTSAFAASAKDEGSSRTATYAQSATASERWKAAEAQKPFRR